MKITATAALLALLAVPLYAQDRGCVDTVEAGADLFPNKVEPKHSKYWDIEYFGAYKIVTNKKLDVTYLLYQCGTDIPAVENDGRHQAIFEIPLVDVAISATPQISFIEQLELRDQIDTFLSNKDFIASPCFLEAVEAGNITTLNRGDGNTTGPALENQGPNPSSKDEKNFTTFIGSRSSAPPFADKVVAVSESEETTNDAIFEWVKFFSVFFNKEKEANEVFQKAESRRQCVSENAAKTLTDSPDKPKLLWGKYFVGSVSRAVGGWVYLCTLSCISIHVLNSAILPPLVMRQNRSLFDLLWRVACWQLSQLLLRICRYMLCGNHGEFRGKQPSRKRCLWCRLHD